MKQVKIIYFLNQNKIEPFLKEQKENNNEYYYLKRVEQNIYNNEEKKEILFGIKIKRYIELLEKGYNYLELKETINEGIEYISNKRNWYGVEELYNEIDALEVAYKSIEPKKRTKTVK